MMTPEEELHRYLEERDMLEQQCERDAEIMKQIEAETDLYEENAEWNYAWDEYNSAQNEIMSLTSAIDELQEYIG